MLSYVAAFATAATLFITPILANAEDVQSKKQPTEWTKLVAANTRTIQIERAIELSGPRPSYFLSALEQDVLRKALFRSVRVVHLGTVG